MSLVEISKKRRIARLRRHRRIRKKIFGTPECPRLVVFRSNKFIYAQIIDDTRKHTIVSSNSSVSAVAELVNPKDKGKLALSRAVGKHIAQLAKERGITKIVFDRGGYLYHGRVKALADGAREGGLKF